MTQEETATVFGILRDMLGLMENFEKRIKALEEHAPLESTNPLVTDTLAR